MIVILLGVLASVAAELVTWLNQKLQGTVLKGTASFLIAFVMAVVGGAVKVLWASHFDWTTLKDFSALSAAWSQVFAVSQVYFVLIAQKLNLKVNG